ncbi:NADH-quinone oxidoreductase subunit J [Sedimenticola selenatireducens]|jgi:NADH-quinone oxidoreductase subunit J|uniref:NADH-quinone oxidoreductase subunit J n=1 Tax=Sedimenticola selenatireducens TaxID=191960 RepID=A0A558DKJ9_9GAMM|nr:NADH-quinone oxidoreductase subunit J [Sedimenticola selenatireducens]TVO71246.1 NADH-quinone oxidoreductase subunit J [Sedimenticola selenatireducens]TVT61548.1 MAG: NADH-quinone oxidoreductase subunit J [Sedimenticola selenatireducens]
MTFEKFVFYVFAAILVFAATMVITRRNPVHSALFLVLAFFSSAGIWLLAEAEFLAIVLILVYVGAVMVLFLFVVMMLDIDLATLKAGFIKHMPVGVLVALVMAIEMFMVVGPANFGLEKVPAPAAQGAGYNNTEELGSVLYTVYMYPFEIAAVILLVGIIAAIGLTMRKRPETKFQDPSVQVRVKKADRLRVIKMDAED